MAITLHLAPEQEAKLLQKAQRRGQKLESYVISTLLPEGDEPVQESQTLDRMLAGRIGLFQSEGPGYRAKESENSFADYLAEKHAINRG